VTIDDHLHPDCVCMYCRTCDELRAERDKLRGALRMIHKGHIAPRTLAGLALNAPTWEPPEDLR
jgi:hypothetical protein